MILNRLDVFQKIRNQITADLENIRITKIYQKKNTIFEYLELIFYVTGSSISLRISSYKLFARILKIIGAKLK